VRRLGGAGLRNYFLGASSGAQSRETVAVIALAGFVVLLELSGRAVQATAAWLASAGVVRARTALGLLAPWAGLAVALYGAGVWVFLQPMQMRGMLH